MSACQHESTSFDRSLCACGSMHDYCDYCGQAPDCSLNVSQAEEKPVSAMLGARRHSHGDFTTNAAIAQELKELLRACPGWAALTSTEREALDMIVHKIGRVLSGNPHFPDHWHDIAGYAQLYNGHDS